MEDNPFADAQLKGLTSDEAALLRQYGTDSWVKGVKEEGEAFRLRRRNCNRNMLSRIPDKLQLGHCVADVGCGPFGGMFESIRYPVMYGVDPLFAEYWSKGILDLPKDVKPIVGTAQAFDLPQQVDLIWCRDTLDHVGDLKEGLWHLMSWLKSGGRLLLHHNARFRLNWTQHNVGSSPEDVLNIMSPWKRLFWDGGHTNDPTASHAVIHGVWEKK